MITSVLLCLLIVLIMAIIFRLIQERQTFLSEENKTCGAGTFLSGDSCQRCEDGTTVNKNNHTESECSPCSSSDKLKFPMCVGSKGPASGKPEWDGILDCVSGKTPNREDTECV